MLVLSSCRGRCRGTCPAGDEEKLQLGNNLRVLVHELCAVVDLVVNHHKQVLLCIVLRNILIRVLLLGHFDFGLGGGEGRNVGALLFRGVSGDC